MTTPVYIALISALAGVAGALLAWAQGVRTARVTSETNLAVQKLTTETNLAIQKLNAESTLAIEELKAETARVTTEATVGLEKLKLDSERRKHALEVAKQESAPLEEALALAWRDIQTIKSSISKLTGPGEYDPEQALLLIHPSTASLVQGYEQWGHILQSHSADVPFHTAMRCAQQVASDVEEFNSRMTSSVRLTSDMIDQLLSARVLLTEQQVLLGETRQRVRQDLLRTIMEIL